MEKSMTLRETRPVQKEQQRSFDCSFGCSFDSGSSRAVGSDGGGGGGVASAGDNALAAAASPSIAASAAAAMAAAAAAAVAHRPGLLCRLCRSMHLRAPVIRVSNIDCGAIIDHDSW